MVVLVCFQRQAPPLHEVLLCRCRLVSETEAAQEEAVENARILAPLRKYLAAFMEPSDYQSLPETFQARRTCHSLCLLQDKTTASVFILIA